MLRLVAGRRDLRQPGTQQHRKLHCLYYVRDQAVVEQDRVRDHPDRHLMVRPTDDVDGVPCAELTLVDDAQIGARAGRSRESLDETRLPDANPSLKQGSRGCATSRSVDPMLQRSPTIAPETSTPSVVRFSPKGAMPRSRPRLALPHAGLLDGVGVDGLVWPAVHRPVRLVVAVHVDSANADATFDRRLPDRRRHRSSLRDDPAGAADVDAEERARHCAWILDGDTRGSALTCVADGVVSTGAALSLSR